MVVVEEGWGAKMDRWLELVGMGNLGGFRVKENGWRTKFESEPNSFSISSRKAKPLTFQWRTRSHPFHPNRNQQP